MFEMTKINKWTNEEIIILVENYANGVDYVSLMIPNHTKDSIKKKASRLGIIVDRDNLNFNYFEIKEAVNESYSYADVFRKLNKSKSGDSYKVIKGFILRNHIDTSHFDPYAKNKFSLEKEKNIEEWLQIGTNIGSRSLKEKLYKKKIKERICEICGQDENWNGKKMSLILDHINGINNDNRLENLRIVCPNCNATLDTHCRGENNKNGNNRLYKNTIKKIEKNKKIRENSILKRKVDRPSYQILISDIKEFGYVSTGKKYSVSDNAVRKWIRMYEKHGLDF